VKERVRMISKFNYVICSIEEFNSLDTMTIDELQSLFVHEQRMKSRGEEEQVLKISHEDRTERERGREQQLYNKTVFFKIN
jgi:hypothetical protein